MPRPTDRPQTFIHRVEVAPGQPVTIPATHIEHGADGYRLRLGIGRQAPTAEAAR